MKRFFSGKTRVFLLIGCLMIVAAIVLELCGMGVGLDRGYTGETAIRLSLNKSYDMNEINSLISGAVPGAVVIGADVSNASVAAQATPAPTAEPTVEPADDAAADDAAAEDAAPAAEETPEATEAPAPVPVITDPRTDVEIRIGKVDSLSGVKAAILSAVDDGARLLSAESIIAGDTEDASLVGGWLFSVYIARQADPAEVESSARAALEGAGYAVRALSVETYAASPAVEGEEAIADAVRISVSVNDSAMEAADAALTALSAEYPDAKLSYIVTTDGHASLSAMVRSALKVLLSVFVLLVVYIWIRHDLASAASAAMSLVISTAVSCALVILIGCFYRITPAAVGAIGATEACSLLLSLALFDKILSLSRKVEYQRMKREDLEALAEKPILRGLLLVAVLAAVALIALAFTGSCTVVSMAVAIAIGFAVNAVTFWAFTGKSWISLSTALANRKLNRSAKKA